MRAFWLSGLLVLTAGTVCAIAPAQEGTAIAANSDALLGFDDPERLRARYAGAGRNADALSDDELLARMRRRGEAFRDSAPNDIPTIVTGMSSSSGFFAKRPPITVLVTHFSR